MNFRRGIIMLFAVLMPIGVNAQQKDTTAKTEAPSWFWWIEGQSTVEKSPVTNRVYAGENVSTMTIGYQKSPMVGFTLITAFANDLGSTWHETVVAWSFAPTETFNFSGGPGIEHTGEHNIRGRVNLNYEHGHDFAYAQFDFGQGAPWMWMDATSFVTKTVGVGVMAQLPDLGVGPKIEVLMGEHFSTWVAAIRHPQTNVNRAAVGFRIKMGN